MISKSPDTNFIKDITEVAICQTPEPRLCSPAIDRRGGFFFSRSTAATTLIYLIYLKKSVVLRYLICYIYRYKSICHVENSYGY